MENSSHAVHICNMAIIVLPFWFSNDLNGQFSHLVKNLCITEPVAKNVHNHELVWGEVFLNYFPFVEFCQIF